MHWPDTICAVLLGTLQHIVDCFGIPLASDKTEGLATGLVFLGITIDLVAMECHLPVNKLVARGGGRKMQLRELQSFLGKLNFPCRIIPMGRIFCRRMSLATAGVNVPQDCIRLTKDLRAEIWDLGLFFGILQWLIPVDDRSCQQC